MNRHQFVATVIPSPFEEGRFVLCRQSAFTMRTVVSDHCNAVSAERERKKLQAKFDFEAEKRPVDPDQPRQLVLGFCGPEQGDA